MLKYWDDIMKHFLTAMAMTPGLVLLVACSRSESEKPESEPAGEGARPMVYVVHYPLQYFAERIGGEHVEVVFPAPPDVDPAYWAPEEDTIVAYQQARAVADALSALRPEHQEAFQLGLAALENDLQSLDRELEGLFSLHPSRPLIFSHPVYQYLVRRYNLNARSVHWEPDEMPPEAEWQSLEALRADHPATCMIWEGAPRQDIVQRLTDLGLATAVFDPCGNVPEEGDFLAVMRRNIQNLAALPPDPPP